MDVGLIPQEVHFDAFKNLFDLFGVAGLVVMITENGNNRDGAVSEIQRKILGFARQSQRGEIAAQRDDVGIARNVLEERAEGTRRFVVNMKIADGGDPNR